MMSNRHRDEAQAGAAHKPGWGRVLLTFIAIAFLQLALEHATLNPYDEGLVLYGAARVAQGELPYRDFWSLYGPGSFYALAGLDRLFGESVLTGRLFDVASRAGIVLLVFALIRRQGNRVVALGGASMAFVLLIGVREYLFPALPATFFALLALALVPSTLRRHPGAFPWQWAVPGAAAGAAALFRPDFGLAALLACAWALAAVWRAEQPGARRVMPAIAALVAGALVVSLPLFAWLLAQMPAAILYDNLVGIPAQVYVSHRSLPFPAPVATLHDAFARRAPRDALVLLVYVPLMVALLGATLAFARRRHGVMRSVLDRGSGTALEAALVLLVLLCVKGSVRVQVLHMLPALLVALVVVGLAWPGPEPRHDGDRAWRRALLALGLLTGLGLAAVFVRDRQAIGRGDPPSTLLSAFATCDPPRLPRLGCFALDADRTAILRYLAEHVRPGDRLYVGAGRHDKVYVNNLELYFLSGLPAATRWADLHPGVQTTAAVQRAMIAEFQTRPAAFVVRNTEWDDWDEPNASRFGSGVTMLDDYLHAHYVPAFRAGSFSVSVPLAGGQPR